MEHAGSIGFMVGRGASSAGEIIVVGEVVVLGLLETDFETPLMQSRKFFSFVHGSNAARVRSVNLNSVPAPFEMVRLFFLKHLPLAPDSGCMADSSK